MTIPNNWAKEAACQDTELDFYSQKTENKRAAKALCNECPVKQLCLQNALDNREVFGIWGGADQDELRKNQAINSKGESHPATRSKIRCGNCGPLSSKYLTVVERKRTQTHLKCTNCGLHWWAKKLINRKMTNL